MRRPPRCGRCGKFRFATQEAAERRLRWIQDVGTTEVLPERAYLGDCGWWHLTSIPEWAGTTSEGGAT